MQNLNNYIAEKLHLNSKIKVDMDESLDYLVWKTLCMLGWEIENERKLFKVNELKNNKMIQFIADWIKDNEIKSVEGYADELVMNDWKFPKKKRKLFNTDFRKVGSYTIKYSNSNKEADYIWKFDGIKHKLYAEDNVLVDIVKKSGEVPFVKVFIGE